jgi:hypothetical protein
MLNTGDMSDAIATGWRSCWRVVAAMLDIKAQVYTCLYV